VGWRSSDQLDEFTFAVVFGHERQDGSIHGRELSFPMHRESQQIRFGQLLMARQSRSAWFMGLDKAEFIRPEPVPGIPKVRS
jgi:hypothetical protein